MFTNILTWIENIWNLRTILDKYLPMIKAHATAVKTMAATLFELKAELARLKSDLGYASAQDTTSEGRAD